MQPTTSAGRSIGLFVFSWGPSCIDRPMDLPLEVLFFLKHRQPNLCIFLKKTQRSILFFYIRIGTPGPTYVSLLTRLYIFKLFYMLLYIIVIVIIYLTDTYICKKTISHILLTYKNNFLTINPGFFGNENPGDCVQKLGKI